ncbi:hypothetical protein [Bizionia myxarmorum]|uniref:Uncharacterized protein n=1 Tax=Bizionia myxarmorum TaxID=291186 RepID=A0A5D0QXW9_9FLAO|nr:hypothetical protein [Bizionia myxarmorum]TYB74057.1 hypothetical protein ES674_15005 [Bizionia myxarmorum]
MNVEDILENINIWKKEPFYENYYRAGVYHKRILDLLNLDNLEDLKNYFIKLKTPNQIDLKTNTEFLEIKEEERKLQTLYKESEGKYTHQFTGLSSYHYEDQLDANEEQQKPFYAIAKKDEIANAPHKWMTDFFFGHYKGAWQREDMADFDQFLTKFRRTKILIKQKGKLIKNWNALVLKALTYTGYDIIIKNNRNSYGIDKDSFQILSAHLLPLQTAVIAKNYRLDELGCVQLDLKNGIMAALEITEMPLKTNFNEVELGEIKSTQPISYSGYDNSLYVLNSLTLFFEGYQFKFEFEAFAVLSNGFNTNQNAAARLYDNIIDD